MAQKEKNTGAVCDMKALTSTGNGIWKYYQPGLAETEAGKDGYFAEAFERYGMRAGDVVLVNAGDGKAYILGV